MRKLLPLILGLIGLALGVGAGLALKPAAEEKVVVNPCGPAADGATEQTSAASTPEGGDAGNEQPTKEYVKLNNQFIVPVVGEGSVQALVILSLSLEVKFGTSEKVYAVEPKLRDAFLQVLFDHANSGGFSGAYTNSNTMDVLRQALLETARQALGATVSDVLIVDIVRQDN